ncbi:pre-60S ribosomal particles component [Basidiobolus ranarum]|uniref:Pre-60S ribosomal particles component n=1 Tax=Basidiobolus ranarum TaxID=34480 RepID=A0ABR2WIR1_9FUNG
MKAVLIFLIIPVVKLFNAIKAQQREADVAPVTKSKVGKDQVSNMSKAKFLDVLKGGKAV